MITVNINISASFQGNVLLRSIPTNIIGRKITDELWKVKANNKNTQAKHFLSCHSIYANKQNAIARDCLNVERANVVNPRALGF